MAYQPQAEAVDEAKTNRNSGEKLDLVMILSSRYAKGDRLFFTALNGFVVRMYASCGAQCSRGHIGQGREKV
jgi:hypothetical protein